MRRSLTAIRCDRASQTVGAAIYDNATTRATASIEAFTVLTSMPQPFFLDKLVAMASPEKQERWDRRDALDGLARLVHRVLLIGHLETDAQQRLSHRIADRQGGNRAVE